MRTTMTPLGAVARGVLAGVGGTVAMTGWQELSARLRGSSSGEGDEGSSPPPDGEEAAWAQASAPAQVARRVAEGVFQVHVPAERIPLLTNAMHWAYGAGWGAVYGLVRGSVRGPALRQGLAFGAAVWTMSYVQLVPMGLYEPPWRYPPQELALDLSYHLVYGAGVGVAYRVLER
jgi:hypothetical protein